MKCDVHPWMLAWHLPLDHPYGTVTADDGTFSIADLPAGTHKLTLWHEVLGVIDDNVSITIEPDGHNVPARHQCFRRTVHSRIPGREAEDGCALDTPLTGPDHRSRRLFGPVTGLTGQDTCLNKRSHDAARQPSEDLRCVESP